jgi:hypothetical protein
MCSKPNWTKAGPTLNVLNAQQKIIYHLLKLGVNPDAATTIQTLMWSFRVSGLYHLSPLANKTFRNDMYKMYMFLLK